MRQCPKTLIAPRSQWFHEMFLACHSFTPTFGGLGIIQHSWPDEGGVNDQLHITVQAFHVIRTEYMKLTPKPEAKGTTKPKIPRGGRR